MTAVCFSAIHLCRVRVTRLDQIGNPTAGPNNVYVTGTPISLGVTPQIQAGDDKVLLSGCDCISARYRGYDKLKNFDFTLDLAQLEPALFELILGATAIVDSGVVVGWSWPEQVTCDDTPQPNVCLEGWQDTWEDDHQADSPYRYIHWIWPSTHWMVGTHTLQNDFNQPQITGWSRGNPNWGEGIFGDLIQSCGSMGDVFFTDSIPTAECGYQTQAIT